MLSTVAILGLFLLSLAVTVQHGLKWALPYAVVPGLILLGPTNPLPLKGLPDMTTMVAISYGCLLGLPFSGRAVRLIWHPVDTVLMLLVLVYGISNLTNLALWDGISGWGNEFLQFVVPYFVARVGIVDLDVRRALLKVLTVILVGLLPFALYEWRLSPNWLSRQLELLNITTTANEMVLYRFGLARTLLTFQQPIDTGNSALLIMGLMLVLLMTTGQRDWRNWKTWGPLALAVFIGWTSMSFTFVAAFMSAAGTLLLLVKGKPWMVHLVWVSMYALLFGLWQFMLSRPPPEDFGDMTVEASWTMRVIIVQNTYGPMFERGLFGTATLDTIKALSENSVDNAYILMVLLRGWIYMGLFLLLPAFFAESARRAAAVLSPAERLPIYACFAVLIGVMVGMFTVWFGFTFAKLWLIVLGSGVSLCQLALQHRAGERGPAELPVGVGPAAAAQPVGGLVTARS